MGVRAPREFAHETIDVVTESGKGFRFVLTEQGAGSIVVLEAGVERARLTFDPQRRPVANRLAHALRRLQRRMDEVAATLPGEGPHGGR